MSKLYSIWYHMNLRCHDEKNKDFQYYGGRGIKIYPIWRRNFKVFEKWALKFGYQEGLQIGRIDKNKNYEPSNCKIVTYKENQQNKRQRKDLRILEINGEKLTIKQISEKYNIPLNTINNRYAKEKRGIDLIKPISVKNRPFK